MSFKVAQEIAYLFTAAPICVCNCAQTVEVVLGVSHCRIIVVYTVGVRSAGSYVVVRVGQCHVVQYNIHVDPDNKSLYCKQAFGNTVERRICGQPSPDYRFAGFWNIQQKSELRVEGMRTNIQRYARNIVFTVYLMKIL